MLKRCMRSVNIWIYVYILVKLITLVTHLVVRWYFKHFKNVGSLILQFEAGMNETEISKHECTQQNNKNSGCCVIAWLTPPLLPPVHCYQLFSFFANVGRGNERTDAAGLAEIPSEDEENHNKQVGLDLQKMINKTKVTKQHDVSVQLFHSTVIWDFTVSVNDDWIFWLLRIFCTTNYSWKCTLMVDVVQSSTIKEKSVKTLHWESYSFVMFISIFWLKCMYLTLTVFYFSLFYYENP